MAYQWVENPGDAVRLWSFLYKTFSFDTNKIHRLSLQTLVRKVGSQPTPDQKKNIALRCSQL
jgi:hypothetical protein